jgi:hypothetical protein
MHKTPTNRDLRFDTVRVTAWVYAFYWLTIAPAFAFSSSLSSANAAHLWAWALWCSCAAAAVSAAYRKRIGYYFCFLFSGLILLAPPIGTVLGWNMLRALRLNRDRFGIS